MLSHPSKVKRSRRLVICVLCAACAVFAVADLPAITHPPQGIVFEHKPDRSYPELEFECLDAVTVDAFAGDSGHRFHFTGTLTLQYEEGDVRPGASVPLTFTFDALDGEGSEYDLERGLKFNIDCTFYDWGVKYGNDVEGDFIPPMWGGSARLDDRLFTIWEKSQWCFGSAAIGLYTVEGFAGNEVRIPIYIKTPGNKSLVWFQESNEDSIVLSFKYGATDQVTLRIHSSCAQDVTLAVGRSDSPGFIVDQTESLIQPGFEINVVKPKWSWFPNPCRQKTWFKEYFPWFEGEITTRSVPIDYAQSESLEWVINNMGAQTVLVGIQDLAVRSRRLSSGWPKEGAPDTIVSVIENLHGGIGREYEWIRLDYSIHGASTDDEVISIGSKTLTSSSPELAAFNSGKAGETRVEFVYDERGENYIFTGDHRWNPRVPVPRYVVEMTSKLKDTESAAHGWLCIPDDPEEPGYNICKIPFQAPMPDFAIDSLVVDCPPHLQFRSPANVDSVSFVFRVTNRGADYTGTTVPITCNMQLQSMVSLTEWSTVSSQEIFSAYVPAMVSGARWDSSFSYVLPDVYTAPPGIDRALFFFEVNGNPGTSGVSEDLFDLKNNTMYTYVSLADYPDTAYASPTLYSNGQDIEPNLPCINATPPCDDIVYVYIADETFSGSGDPPGNLVVQIGVGDFGSSPRDSSWTWTSCTFSRDFIDGDGQLWKVYEGTPCSAALVEDRDYSYCFRATLNSSHAFPSYIYVDGDGASTGAERYCSNDSGSGPYCTENKDNSYFYDNAGFAKIAPLGAMLWSPGAGNLFQDNFPADPMNIESYVRADMAADISDRYSPFIIPGDSITIWCRALDIDGIAEDGNGPRVYLNVRCPYIGGPGSKPDLYGPPLEGTYGRYHSDDGEWTVIQGDTALLGGEPALHWYMFDLNDSLLTRGYVVEYYFSAHDNQGGFGTFPYDAMGDNLLEFTCLPTLASDILFVDDYDGIVSKEGIVQNHFDRAFRAVLPPENQPDRYDVTAAASGISNGLGSRAHANHLIAGYKTIIWDSGDLAKWTICDGAPLGDKSNDCGVLSEWLAGSGNDANLWILGDNVACEVSSLVSPEAIDLMGNKCGVRFDNDSYFVMSGCDTLAGGSIVVRGMPSGPVLPVDSFYLYGGNYENLHTPPFNSFDVLASTGSGLHTLAYPEFDGSPYYGGVHNTTAKGLGFVNRTMWFGFSFMHVRACSTASPAIQFELMKDVLTYFGVATKVDYSDGESPHASWLAQNYPNPFNPSTRIRFGLSKRSFVDLKIYNVAGQLVKTLLHGRKEAGAHQVVWDGTNNTGKAVASGIYFCRMAAGDFVQSKKLVLLR